MSNITRYRADTYPVRVTLRSSTGALLDLTGCSFLFTVNAEAVPDDAVAQIFQSIGSIVSPADEGVVEFPILGTTAEGSYFFDIEMTDSVGKVRTVEKGEYILLQDITKSEVAVTHTFEDLGVDGTNVYLGGIDSPLLLSYTLWSGPHTVKMATRNSVRVLSFKSPVGATTVPAVLTLSGGTALKPTVKPFYENIEISCLMYLKGDAVLTLGLQGVDYSSYILGRTEMTVADGLRLTAKSSIATPTVAANIEDLQAYDPGLAENWYRMRVLFEKDTASVKTKGWIDGDSEPEAWAVSVAPGVNPNLPFAMFMHCTFYTYAVTDIIELAEISFRVWK